MKIFNVFCVFLFTCVTSVFTVNDYDSLSSSLETRDYDPDYKLQMPVHGLLQKFAGLLKNIFTLHRGKIDDLSGKLDDAFHRVATIEGKTKEYEDDYSSYPSSSKDSCCPDEEQVLEYLKTHPINIGVRLKLFDLIPLWGKIGRLEGLIRQNNAVLRTYLKIIHRYESYLSYKHNTRKINTTEIERYLVTAESG